MGVAYGARTHHRDILEVAKFAKINSFTAFSHEIVEGGCTAADPFMRNSLLRFARSPLGGASRRPI